MVRKKYMHISELANMPDEEMMKKIKIALKDLEIEGGKMTSYGSKDGHGKGIGMPDGGRRNINKGLCPDYAGDGYGTGEGKGSGTNRK